MKRKAMQVGRREESNMYNHGASWLRGPLIGKGGFGSVYLANLKNPKSRNGYFPPVMAVKSAEVSVSASLQKEKEVFNDLHGCPYILKCFGEETTTDKNGEMVYNVLLEYASGGTLAALIKKSNSCGLPESDVRRYTRSILQGIDFIHERGYVHCDLKPQNILLVSAKNGGTDCNYIAKIGDFGLAKKAEKSKKRKFDPFFGGTTLYMAPETVVDHVQEPPCDIWALGCIVLEMLTGKPGWDFNPDISTEELMKKIGDRYESPIIPKDISKDGKDFLKACLVKNPIFRFTSEMLLDHPFVSGLGEEEGCEPEEISNAEDVVFSVISSEVDSEFWSCSSSEDWTFTSADGFPCSSWLDDVEEGNAATSSNKMNGDNRALEALAQISSKTMLQHQPVFTIPAGA